MPVQILVVVILLLLMQVVTSLGAQVDSETILTSNTLVSVGFMLLAAFTFGELFRRMRLPGLLGYLVAGMLFGPHLVALVLGSAELAPLSEKVIHDLGLINVLAVGVIGTTSGAEIQVGQLREQIGKITVVAASIFCLTVPAVTVTVMILGTVYPESVPFVQGIPNTEKWIVALIFGVLAAGMSPAATLALLQELRAKGPFTSLVLGVVVLGDILLVASFLLTLAAAKLAVSPAGLHLEGLAEAIPHVAGEFAWSAVLGAIAGAAFIAYLHFVKREALLFALAVIFVTSFAAERLHAETLLAFIFAGFIVQNFSRYGHDLVHIFERMALPVFMVYFMTQTARLDVGTLATYIPLTVALVAVRVLSFYAAVHGSMRMLPPGDPTRKNLWRCFFSQGGVDLVLAGAVAAAIPSWGEELRTVVTATVIVYIMLGPPLLARALDTVGESAAARERGVEDLGARSSRSSGSGVTEFKMPMVADPALQARLFALREEMLAIKKTRVDGELSERCAARAAKLLNASRTITALFDRSVAIIESKLGAEQRSAKLAVLAAELDGAIVAASRPWSGRVELNPVRAEELTSLLAALEQMEPFQSSYRVMREAELFTVRGSRMSRMIRRGRRLRRTIVGSGTRIVPLGRLWRYYVTLEVPARLWTGLAPHEADLWWDLLEHYRVARLELHEAIQGELKRPATGLTGPIAAHGGHDHASASEHGPGSAPGSASTSSNRLELAATQPKSRETATQAASQAATGDEDGRIDKSGSSDVSGERSSWSDETKGEPEGDATATDETEERTPTAEELLIDAIRLAAAAARVRERKIQERARAIDERVRDVFVASLAETWTELLTAAELAGTFERPMWSFRPSRRFDAAQAAKSELIERLVGDAERAAGYRDAVISLAHAQRFVGRTLDFVARVAERMRTVMDAATHPFTELIERRGAALVQSLTAATEGGDPEEALANLPELRAGEDEPLPDDSMILPRRPPLPSDEGLPSDDAREAASHEVEAFRSDLEVLVGALEHLSAAIAREDLISVRAVAPERALLEVPEELNPIGGTSKSVQDRSERRQPIRLRAWLQRSFLQESTVARVAAEEELELSVARAMARLHHARQVADYYAVDLQSGGIVDRGFVGRVITMIDASRKDLSQGSAQAREKLLTKIREHADGTVDPLRQGRWDEIRRRLRKAGDAERVANQRAAIGESIRLRVQAWIVRLAPVAATLRDEIVALFAEHTPPAAQAAYVDLVYRSGAANQIPAPYERLFTSVPAESVGLIVERPEYRQARLALDAWRAGVPGGLLVWGTRGSGRRTCVRWLAAAAADDVDVNWIRLSPGLEREADVTRQVAEILQVRPVRDFAVLAALVRGAAASESRDADEGKRPKVIVVENAERLFRRNPEGLARMRRFLDLVSSNARDVMWIVLMTEASVRLLDPILELRARFPTSLRIGPASPATLEAMISARHRLSALSLEINSRRPRLGEFVRNPLAAVRSLRGPSFGAYERLAILSGGNPRQALRLWLASTKVVGGENGRAIVGPITAMPCPLLGDLPLSGRVLLAALTLHGPLRRQELMGMQAPGSLDIDAELARLEHLRLIAIERSSDRRDLGGNPLVRIDSRVMQPVTAELRANNLL